MINKKILYFIFFIILFLSIGFSAFQNNLSIDNIFLNVNIDKDIRVMGISVNESKDAFSTYEDYNVSNIKSNVTLSNSNSYIIYKIPVYNLGNVVMGIRSISINYDNLSVSILNYDLKSKLCDDKCASGVKKDLLVKISYKDGLFDSLNTSYDIKIDFIFGRIFNIDYKDIDISYPKEIIEGDTLTLNIPDREDSFLKVFMNKRKLVIDSDYQYSSGVLTIPNVDGDISMFFKLPICQRATVLHTEECTGKFCGGMGFTNDGKMKTTTITYGSLGTQGTLNSGDAFDCDTNGDGEYNPETERFYYVTTMGDDSRVAVLIYYNNVSAGEPNNNSFYAYDDFDGNWFGPRVAIQQLPTRSQRSNISLSNTERKITNEYGTNNTKDNHTFPSVFSYDGYSARFLTYQELKKVVNNIPTWKSGEFNDHLYLSENTKFSNGNASVFDGYWLENPRYGLPTYAWFLYTSERRVHSADVKINNIYGVRPVIEISFDDILY